MTNYRVDNKRLLSIEPKWRLVLLILIASLSFIIYDWRFYLANILVTFSLSFFINVSYNQLYKPLATHFYTFIIIFTMHAISGNYIDGVKVILRLYSILIFASLILSTTSYSDMVEGLTSLCKPLSYVGLEPTRVAIAFVLAIRFMSLIIDTFEEVKIAQKARGIDKNFMAILVPSIIKTIKMADNIAEAIEARCWE